MKLNAIASGGAMQIWYLTEAGIAPSALSRAKIP